MSRPQILNRSIQHLVLHAAARTDNTSLRVGFWYPNTPIISGRCAMRRTTSPGRGRYRHDVEAHEPSEGKRVETFQEVERRQELPTGAIRRFYANVGALFGQGEHPVRMKAVKKENFSKLEKAGVWQAETKGRSRQGVRWLAFAGRGEPRPIFHAHESVHLFQASPSQRLPVPGRSLPREACGASTPNDNDELFVPVPQAFAMERREDGGVLHDPSGDITPGNWYVRPFVLCLPHLTTGTKLAMIM